MEPIEEILTEKYEKVLHGHFSLVGFHDNSMLSGMQQAEISDHFELQT